MTHLHFFIGNDDFAMRRAIAQFEKQFSDPSSASMNMARLDARTVNEGELNNQVSALPFLASQRLVVLENVSKRFNGQEGHKRFGAFLESVPPSARLVALDLEEIKEKDAAAHWLAKWAAKHPESAEFKLFLLPRRAEMPGWMMTEAKRQGGSLEPAAAARLAEMVGVDTRMAAQEIGKLLTYVNLAHPVGLEDVEAVSIVSASVDIFDMVDSLAARDGKRAQRLLTRLLEEKEAFEIFGMVSRQFRLLTLARDLMDSSGLPSAAAVELGLHPFVAEKAWKQAAKFSASSLRSIYHHLLKMDEAAKTGQMSLDLGLETLVVELTR